MSIVDLPSFIRHLIFAIRQSIPMTSLQAMKTCRILTSSLLLLAIPFAAQTAPPPIPVKVVVVAMFERGEDTGDTPGE